MLNNENYQKVFFYETKQDIHIHPRPDCFSKEVLIKYLDLCTELGINKIGFVEHGRRINKKHQGILNDRNDIFRFAECVDVVKKNYSGYGIDIKSGIEIDYSQDVGFMQNVIEDCKNNEKLDYIIGSVHGFSKKSYKEYVSAVLDLVEKYDIDILGHFILSPEMINYLYEIKKILSIINKKQICLELNKAERYDCGNVKLKSYFLDIALEYKVSFAFGSDAHSNRELISNNRRTWFV